MRVSPRRGVLLLVVGPVLAVRAVARSFVQSYFGRAGKRGRLAVPALVVEGF